MMKVLLVDAFDSFVHIIFQYMLELGYEATVVRNNQIDVSRIRAFNPDLLLLGPGPGHPVDSGYVETVRTLGDTVPILGVCLGHQAIGAAFGARIDQAKNLMHGKVSPIHHDGAGCFWHLETPLYATRYHSLIVAKDTIPDCLTVTAVSGDDGYVMGLRHRRYPIESVQFHPESICTPCGFALFRNFVGSYVDRIRSDERHGGSVAEQGANGGYIAPA